MPFANFRHIGSWLLLLGAFCAGCAPAKEEGPALGDYVSELPFREGYAILQLSDLHFGCETDLPHELAYLDAVVAAARQPDFLMLTGDCFLLGNERIASALFARIRSYGVPYGVTWGNHDADGYYRFSWLEELVQEGAGVYRHPKGSPLSGASNYVVNLVQGGKPVWQLYSLDSHSCVQTNPFRYEHPPIDEGQVSWYESECEAAKGSDGSYVPSIAYFHIPLRETAKAYADEGGLTTYLKWEKHESISPSYRGSSFFSSAKKRNAKALFYGHDHGNDFVADYDGVTLGYGVKTDKELYYARSEKRGYDLIGGSLLTLHEDATFDLTHLYVQDDAVHTTYREGYK
jgi:3',5'-cyclic AMP phosphodiesterase CpdA